MALLEMTGLTIRGAVRSAEQRLVHRLRWLLMAAPLVLPAAAFAQIYVCKDAGGHTLTSDRPIAECANRPMREIDHHGVTRREIAAPLTAQQRREREQAEEKKRLDGIASEEQRQYDFALTTRYRSEADIAVARKKAIELLDAQMKIDTNALGREMQEMKAAQAAVLAAGKNATAKGERRRLEDAARGVESRLASIERRTADIERTHAKFDQSLKRFLEIKAGGVPAAPAAAAASPAGGLVSSSTAKSVR